MLLSSVYLVSSFSTKNGERYLVSELLVICEQILPQSTQWICTKTFVRSVANYYAVAKHTNIPTPQQNKCSLSVIDKKEIATKIVFYLVYCHYLVAY